MESFLSMVEQRKDEIDEQIMDLLLSFVDFECFKEMMLFSRAHLVATTPKLKSSKAAALGLKNTNAPAVTKEEEMKELGISVQDEKSNSSGSDSNPSADEIDVRTILKLILFSKIKCC